MFFKSDIDDIGRSHYLLRPCMKRKIHQIEDDEKDTLKAEIKKINNEKQALEWEIEMLRQHIEEQENNEDMT